MSNRLLATGVRLNSLSDDGLKREFEQSFNSLWALERLNDVLKTRYSDEANSLQVLVIKRLRELRASGVPFTPPSDPASAWMTTFLSRRNLSSPDRRPLHRYRMTDAEFGQALAVLRQLMAKRKLQPDAVLSCAIFATFCAEWFRREATSTFRKWDALAPDIFPSIHGNQKREMAQVGLAYWKRPLLEMNGANEYLLSLALEGGVPVKIISEDGAGWLRNYLKQLLRFAVAGQEAAAVRGYAHDESYQVKMSYRNDTFVDLCAELAFEVARWRGVIQGEALADIDPVSYLDAKHPEWKDTIPVYIPTGTDSAARALLTGLITERIEVFSGKGIGCERYLVLKGDAWKPALRVQATGEIPIGKFGGIDTTVRWRATPSGVLADHLPSQFALFEPPSDDQQTWRVRPLVDLDPVMVGFPLSESVRVSITASGRAHSFEWPRGGRVVSDILVFEELVSGNDPNILRLARAGSARLASQRVFVLVPDSWVLTADQDVVGRQWHIKDRKLIEISGTCYFSEPGGSGLGNYRVQSACDAIEEELDVTSRFASGVSGDGDFDVREAPLKLTVIKRGVPRAIERRELFVREPGGQWKELINGEVTQTGMVEISWRDPKANIQLERRKFGVVPAGASVRGVMSGPTGGNISLSSLPSWTLSLSDMTKTHSRLEAGRVVFDFLGKPNFRLSAALKPLAGTAIPVMVSLSTREGVVLNALGEVLPPGHQMDLASLRGSRAVSSHRSRLLISRKGSRYQDISVEVDGEFAISTLKPTIEQVMASVDEQDVRLDMHFVGDSRPPIRVARYRWDRPRHELGSVTFPSAGVAVYRSILAPETELALERCESGHFRLPEHAFGPCLLYLRDGPDILTRPLLMTGSAPIPDMKLSSLARSLCISDYRELQRAISERLAELWQDRDVSDDVALLMSMITSLNGLPPTSLEALKNLPQHPKTLLRLLHGASTDTSRQAVWGLQGQLPFVWLAMRVDCWKSVFDVERQVIEDALAQAPGTDAFRIEILVRYFRDKFSSLVEVEPALAVIFSSIGFPMSNVGRPIEEIVESFIREQRLTDVEDVSKVAEAGPLGRRVLDLELPVPDSIRTRFSLQDFDQIYAPMLLAASACGLAHIDHDLEVPLRAALHEHGRYVSEAYPHFFEHFRKTA